jgi:hypothetical protein
MTRCPKDQADLFLDSTYWCFDTLAEALLARERLADLAWGPLAALGRHAAPPEGRYRAHGPAPSSR